MEINFYRDNKGYPHAECSSSFEVLSWYLEEDIQSCVTSCNELIEAINNIQNGNDSFWEGTGNAHTLTLTSNSATIVNEFMDNISPCEIPLDELKEVIVKWLNFIQ